MTLVVEHDLAGRESLLLVRGRNVDDTRHEFELQKFTSACAPSTQLPDENEIAKPYLLAAVPLLLEHANHVALNDEREIVLVADREGAVLRSLLRSDR